MARVLTAAPGADLATQLPGSYLIQRVGAKVVLTANMLGTTLILLAVPAVSSLRALAALLLAMGVLQGPFIPAQNCLKREWMPQVSQSSLPSHFLGRISPIFLPFFLVVCAFSPSRRGGSNEPQAGTQAQETAGRRAKRGEL